MKKNCAKKESNFEDIDKYVKEKNWLFFAFYRCTPKEQVNFLQNKNKKMNVMMSED